MTQPCQDRKDLYRLQYRQGQLLQSRDLSSQVEYEEQLLWWHNRAVHQAYGVLHGYDLDTTTGEIVVNPGLAYDCFGRPLRMVSAMKLSAPSDYGKKNGTFVLFISSPWGVGPVKRSHHNATGMKMSGKRDANLCPVQFAWKPLSEFSIRDGVAIATLSLQASGVIGQPVQTCLDRFRSERRPYIVNGKTISGHTAWEVWKEPLIESTISWGIQVKVDTSAAGFTSDPIYVAQTTPFCGPFPSYVTEVSETGFTLRVAVDQIEGERVPLELPDGLVLLSRIRQVLAVKWMGLEPIASS